MHRRPVQSRVGFSSHWPCPRHHLDVVRPPLPRDRPLCRPPSQSLGPALRSCAPGAFSSQASSECVSATDLTNPGPPLPRSDACRSGWLRRTRQAASYLLRAHLARPQSPSKLRTISVSAYVRPVFLPIRVDVRTGCAPRPPSLLLSSIPDEILTHHSARPTPQDLPGRPWPDVVAPLSALISLVQLSRPRFLLLDSPIVRTHARCYRSQ